MSTKLEDKVYGHFWRTVVRPAILERDGHKCKIRGPKCQVRATDVDHIVPWRIGGAWYDFDNLRAACKTCNRSRQYREPNLRPSRAW